MLETQFLKELFNLHTSHTVIAMDLYSASTIDLAMTDCFLDFQSIGGCPSNRQKPVVDLLVFRHPAQSL